MKHTWKKYLSLMRVNLEQAMVYRGSFFISFAADIVQMLVMLAVWTAVFHRKSQVAGFDYPMMVTYLILSQLINSIHGYNNDAERTISKAIRKGTIVFDLLRPVRYVQARLAENAGTTVIQIIFGIIMFAVFKIVVPGLAGPASVGYFFLFTISFFAGYFIMFSVSIMSGLLSFWMMNNWGLQTAKAAIVSFFSGALVPLSVLPSWLQNTLKVLPFKNIVYEPVMIYMGQYTIPDCLAKIGVQLLWMLILWLLSELLFRLAIRRVSVNGG